MNTITQYVLITTQYGRDGISLAALMIQLFENYESNTIQYYNTLDKREYI